MSIGDNNVELEALNKEQHYQENGIVAFHLFALYRTGTAFVVSDRPHGITGKWLVSCNERAEKRGGGGFLWYREAFVGGIMTVTFALA